MEDKDIIKALECCRDNGTSNTYCDDCAYSVYEDCGARQAKDALDLINRQQAEIERLRKILDKRCDTCTAVITELKKFAERLKAKEHFIPGNDEHIDIDAVYIEDIDETLKEMIEQ